VTRTITAFFAVLLIAIPAAQANVVTINTGSTTVNGQAENAKAVFTTGTNSITVDLFNLLVGSQISDVAQNLSALTFTLTTIPGAVPPITSSAPTKTPDGLGDGFGTVANTGSNKITGATVGTTDPVGWVFSQSGATIKLDDLLGTNHAGPKHTLIGKADASGNYPSANGSIQSSGKKDPHNPFVYYQAEFVLSATGVTAGTSISSAIFQWGTSPCSVDVPACLTVPNTPVPEPRWSSLVLFAGFAVFAFFRKRASCNLG
jgi:hypothetical protein